MGTHNWQFGRDADSRQTPLGHVRGTGSDRRGTHEWLMSRLTAVGLIPLLPWFVYSLLKGVGASHESMHAWLGAPGNLTLMILFIICVFWHGALAGKVVVHDYIHPAVLEFTASVAINFACMIMAIFAIVSVLKIGLGG